MTNQHHPRVRYLSEGGGTVVVLDDSFEKTDLEQKIKDSLAATDVLLVSHG